MKTTKQNTTRNNSKRTTKTAAAAQPASSARSNDTLRIVARSKKNTLRPGTFTHAQVAAAQSSKTVAQAQARLNASGANPQGRRLEVFWIEKQGYASFKKVA